MVGWLIGANFTASKVNEIRKIENTAEGGGTERHRIKLENEAEMTRKSMQMFSPTRTKNRIST